MAKNNEEDHLREVLAYQTSCLLQIADMLVPFLPSTSAKIKKIFDTGVIQAAETTLFPKQVETPVEAV